MISRTLPPGIPLQGEVEQISMMKPKGQSEHETGLLEYLEDIIGTDKYIPLLEESSKRWVELVLSWLVSPGRMRHARQVDH